MAGLKYGNPGMLPGGGFQKVGFESEHEGF